MEEWSEFDAGTGASVDIDEWLATAPPSTNPETCDGGFMVRMDDSYHCRPAGKVVPPQFSSFMYIVHNPITLRLSFSCQT